MANPFYNFILKMLPGRIARSQDVNEQLQEIEAGFDLLVTSLDDKTDLPATPKARAQNLLGFDKDGDPFAYGGHTANRADKWAGWDETGQLAVKSAPDGEPGEIGILWQGVWDSMTNYVARSAVSHVTPATGQVSSWLTLNGATAGQEPGISPDWELLAQEGSEGPQGPEGPPGTGLIAGGTARQVIIKQSATDFDADWELIGIDSLRTASTGFNAALFRDGANDFGILIPGGSDQLKVIATDGGNLFGLTKIQTDHIEDDAINRFKIEDGEVTAFHIRLNEIPLDRLQGTTEAPVTQVNQAPQPSDENTIGAVFDLGDKSFGKLRPPVDGPNQFLPTVLVARLDTELPVQNVYEFRQIDTDFITDQAVTYAKIQNVNANRLLGRVGTVGPAQEIQLGDGFKFDGVVLEANTSVGFLALGLLTDTPQSSDELSAVTIEYEGIELTENVVYAGGEFTLSELVVDAIYEISLSILISGASETTQEIQIKDTNPFPEAIFGTLKGRPGEDNSLSFTTAFVALTPNAVISAEMQPSGNATTYTIDQAVLIIKRLA